MTQIVFVKDHLYGSGHSRELSFRKNLQFRKPEILGKRESSCKLGGGDVVDDSWEKERERERKLPVNRKILARKQSLR